MIHATVSISHDYDGETKTASFKTKKIKISEGNWKAIRAYRIVASRSLPKFPPGPFKTFQSLAE